MSEQTISERTTTGVTGAQPLLVLVDHPFGSPMRTRLLERVLAGAGRRDRLVVWTADDPATLRRLSGRLEVHSRPSGDWAAALRALAAGHDGPLCVVQSRAIPVERHWLRDLRTPLDRGEADVTVPASNAAPYPSAPPDCPDAAAPAHELRKAAATCRSREEFRAVDALHGPLACFAPGVLQRMEGPAGELGGLDVAGRRVVELPRLYVHADEDIPFVSVCMIMKDEEQELAECLASVRPVADEIVIYDTGSTDGSVQLARSLGATVIEGEWRQDFAWARNEALRAARGTWVLSIDADERLEFDPGGAVQFRSVLRDDPPCERLVLELNDLHGSVHAPSRSDHRVPMARLFRRAACEWYDALHEQPRSRPGRPEVRSLNLDGVRFLHRGYLNEYIEGRQKVQRNLSVVAGRQSLPDTGKECFDLGRSLRSAGQSDRALTMFDRAIEIDDNLVITRASLEFAVTTVCEMGLPDAADPYLARLRSLPGGTGPARFLEALRHVQVGRWQEAVDLFDGISDYNDNFTGFREDILESNLAVSLRSLGRLDEAAEAAIRALASNDQSLPAWTVLLEQSGHDDALLRRAVATIDADRLVVLFAKLNSFPKSAQDRLAEALWHVRPGEAVVLAVASRFAASLNDERRIAWAKRLRAAGLETLCPVLGASSDQDIAPARRAMLLARAAAEIDADDLTDAIECLVPELSDDELRTLLRAALQEQWASAGAIVVGGATTAARCVAMVEELSTSGFVTEALSVLRHGTSLDPEITGALVTDRPDLAVSLRQVAASEGFSDLAPVLSAA